MSSIEEFQELVKTLVSTIEHRPLDASLQDDLNREFPYQGEFGQTLTLACKQGMAEGWMGQYEHKGLRYGRVIKPTPELAGYSVDVVDMNDMAGPQHRHPNGEIDFIMPLDEQAQFDGHPAGWLVYGPDTTHSPTVRHGRALVLYLLPEGKIEFTQN